MIRFFFALLVFAFAALVLQHYIPPLPFLDGARVMLLPLVFFFGAMALPVGGMLALAFCCGLMWGALNAQIIEMGRPVVEQALGGTVIIYGLLGAMMNGLRPLFLRGRWEIYTLMSALGTSLLLLVEFFMLSVRRAALSGESFFWGSEIWWRIGGPGLVALLLAPFVYFFLKSVAAWLGCHLHLFAERAEEEARTS